MRHRQYILVTLVSLVWGAIAPITIAAQTGGGSGREVTATTRERALRIARDIMRSARYCALITRDATSGAAARTVDPAPPDSAMTVVFATNPRSRKVRQLALDARVALYYFDAQGQRYVTLYGRARMVGDSAEKRQRWNPEWTPFYPGRERDATLYVVTPAKLEVVSPGDQLTGDSVTWSPVTLHFPARRTAR